MKTLFQIIAAVSLIQLPAAAQSFTYSVVNSRTTITGFSSEPSGTVTVPATLGGGTVSGIGIGAFKDRPGITSIAFASGSSVTKIGAMAFQGCTGLQSVILPEGVSVVPASAFQGCSLLTSVTLPATVTTIGSGAFAGCASLSGITLPSALTSLGSGAFLGCRSLTQLSIPAGVVTLPENLCEDARALTTLTLANGTATIGRAAFRHGTGLTAVVLPASVVAVGDDAFRGASSLTSLALGDGLAVFGAGAVNDCPVLALITVSEANPAFSSLNGVLYNKAATTLQRCPEGAEGTLAIPATVTTLAEGAFAHCAKLTGVTLPALTAIPADAFYCASGLAALSLPAGVSTIGTWAFAGTAGLTSVTFPASLTTLASDAFHHSINLAEAVFQGNAPAMGAAVFDHTATGFAVRYTAAGTGFITPLWMGYPAGLIGEGSLSAFNTWLVENGYAAGTSPLDDRDGDGVSLILAYAFGLDPAQNPAASLPQPVFDGTTLSLTFPNDRAGVGIIVQASSDLSGWSTADVTLTESGTARTASVPVEPGTSRKFLRAVVTY